jgi:pimeloyl-ACP methyl ester carboxylesterase
MYFYLHGFASGPSSRKAQFFQQFFAARGVSVEIPMLDEGDFFDLRLSKQLALLERLCKGQAPVLFGSSMGGYLSTLYAARFPVKALVLMAPAVDFANRWKRNYGEDGIAAWRETGQKLFFHYQKQRELPVSYELLADAERLEAWPVVTAPTLVFHGTRDDVVRQESVEQWVSQTPSAALQLFDAGHELTECLEEMAEESWQFLQGLSLL